MHSIDLRTPCPICGRLPDALNPTVTALACDPAEEDEMLDEAEDGGDPTVA